MANGKIMTNVEFLEKVNNIYDAGDAKCIEYSLDFATKKHEGQFRLSGEPYVIHPIMVASFLMDIGMDAEAIMAALLHDTIEDTDTTEEEIKAKFGTHVAFLVTSVTKLSTFKSNNKTSSLKEAQAENFRNLIMSMFTDMRVLLIKLADRLHNMKTLEFQTPEKQKRIAQETLDIYAPLAGRLGISTYKIELEDIAMKYVYPTEYKELAGAIVEQREVRIGIVEGILEEIKGKLDELKIDGEVFGRPKHMYSIFKKMKEGNKTLDQIYDLIAVRVIVNTVTECYTVLGAIHSLWKPIPGRFKDYISMPKPNLYQSIHTTVVSNFGQIFEIQIRTYEMHKIAEYGIAAHWKYKEGDFSNKKQQPNYGKELRWIREVREVEGELKNSQEFIDTIKKDVLVTDIYVFSPKGDVFSMAKGATCLDFAYRVHSAVGDKCVGAKVNSKMVNIDYELQNGDVIEILTSQSSKGPSRDWLKIVKTPTARAKIRSFFKSTMKEENIKNGREILEREAKRRGYNLYEELMQPNWVDIIMDKYSFSSLDDLYASVGYGGITSGQVLGKLVEFFKKEQAYNNNKNNDEIDVVPEYAASRKPHGVGIAVEGFDDFLVHLSQCCNPVPGDEIIGYISKGRGVSIHRADCSNMRNVPKERLIAVSWPTEDKPVNCVASLRIEAVNTSGLLGQITSTIGALKIQITAANVRLIKNSNKAIIEMSLEIKNIHELEMIIAKIANIQGVLSISRKQ